MGRPFFRLVLASLGMAAHGCPPSERIAKQDTAPQIVAAQAVASTSSGVRIFFDDRWSPQLCFPTSRLSTPRVLWQPKGLSLSAPTVPLRCHRTGSSACFRCLGQDVPHGPGQLYVDGRALNRPTAWNPRPTDIPVIRSALELIKDRQFDRARQALDTAMQSDDRWTRVWAARQAFYEARRRGGRDATRRAAVKAAQIAEVAGVHSEATRGYRAAAHFATEARDYPLAALLLARADAVQVDLPKEQARQRYERGVLAQQLERYRDAEMLIRRAVADASAAGQRQDALRFAQLLAVVYGQLGRYDEALATLNRYTPRADDRTFLQAEHWSNRADVTMNAMLSGALAMEVARVDRWLQRAGRHFGATGETDRIVARSIERAWWAARAGSATTARALLAHLGEPPTVGRSRWLLELARAMVALRLDPRNTQTGAALARVERAIRAERDGRPSELSARAAELQGDSAAAQGRLDEATQHYQRAVDEVEAVGKTAFLRRSAGGLMRRLAPARHRLIDTLVQSGRVWSAAAVSARSRSLLMHRLDALNVGADRAAWSAVQAERRALMERLRNRCRHSSPSDRIECRRRLDADLSDWALKATQASVESPPDSLNTSPPRDWALNDDAVVLIDPRPNRRWRWFTIHRGTVTTSVSGGIADWLPSVRRAKHIYIAGPHDADIEAHRRLSRKTSPTISAIPSASWLGRRSNQPEGPAVILLGRRDGLRRSAAEVDDLERRWPNARRIEPTDGSNADLRTVLTPGSRLHFVGHGLGLDDDPWSTFLDLGNAGTIGLEDILLHGPAYRLVVLNGCKTGATPDEYAIGLPHAFLTAGSHAVLVTVRPVYDDRASRFIREFYEEGGDQAPAAAFRRAVVASIGRGDPTWKSFRLWGR